MILRHNNRNYLVELDLKHRRSEIIARRFKAQSDNPPWQCYCAICRRKYYTEVPVSDLILYTHWKDKSKRFFELLTIEKH
jgi:hypothetical protein